MRFFAIIISALAASATLAVAEEICGNPCPTGFVWTDKDMGKCVPDPQKPTS